MIEGEPGPVRFADTVGRVIEGAGGRRVRTLRRSGGPALGGRRRRLRDVITFAESLPSLVLTASVVVGGRVLAAPRRRGGEEDSAPA